MKIIEITPKALCAEKDDALLNLHRHIHALYSQHFEGNTQETLNGLTREDLTNGHALVVQEMERRGMKHDGPIDGLPRKQMAFEMPDLPDEIMIVPQFVSIVGSAARGEEGSDVDVLLRTEKQDEKVLIWGECASSTEKGIGPG